MDFKRYAKKRNEVTIEAETVAQAFLEILSLRGIEYLFINSGTGFASIEDAFVYRRKHGKTLPMPLLIPHEVTAAAMAYGYYQITEKPQGILVHVGVGTANALGVIISACKGRIPLLVFSDRTPITEEGNPASRNRYIHWGQEYFDQAGILREFVKWDYELRNPQQIETVLDRAMAMAMSDPRGPVYTTLPREILSSPIGELKVNADPRYDLPLLYPDPSRIESLVDVLVRARFPIIITSSAGRSPHAVRALADLADAAAMGVVSFHPEYMNFPTMHPCHLGFFSEPSLPEADLILVVDCDVPWYPNILKPPVSSTVVQIGTDPFWHQYPVRSFPSDLTIQGDVFVALSQLVQALLKHPDRDEAAIRERKRRLQKIHDGLFKNWREEALRHAMDAPLDFDWVSYNINRVLGENDILVNEYDMRLTQLDSHAPGTYFAHPHSGYLGWGLGAALGIKLAAPDRTVVSALGDGAYFFSVPSSCHFTSAAYGLPVLTVVFDNQGYDGIKMGTHYVHPDGWAAREKQFPLSRFPAVARYEKICEAFGGYGERVEEPDQLAPALERGLEVVRKEKRQALIHMMCKPV